ncbi:putative G-protein coupled receptor 179 isoform X1 [Pogona vitticeps]
MEISLLRLLFVCCFHLEILWAAGIFQHQYSAPPKARTPKTKDWMPSSSSSSSSSLASAFTWVPTPNLEKADPEGLEAAVAFLYSGDVLSLLQANCSQRFEVRDMGKASGPAPALRSYLRGATDTLTHATNFLNMVFQTNDIRESSVKEDVEWYHALVRSVMDGDPQIYRAVLTFDAHPVSSKPQLMVQATKENNEILLQDLSASAENLRNLTWENEWYNFFRFQRAPLLYKRILSNDLKTLDTPKWSQGDSYVMDSGHVKWSTPFLECEDGKFLPNWMVTLSSSFYGLKPDLNPEFKGVVRMDVKIQNVDINQCATGQGWFANTHQCDLNSTQCVPQEKQGFVLGRYLCLCKPGFYGISKASSSPTATNNGQSEEDASQYGATASGNWLECRPCREGCSTCIDGTPCLVQEDWLLRAAVLAFQAFCMLAVFFSMLVSYHFRKSKRIRASGVVLLETILFGSLLLYFPVFILYFKPSIFRCIVLRWVRMLGFAIVYGTITLKLYRVLKIFLSRTAQRVPYMSSRRVLKMLALILLLVLWFLSAWTVGMLENIEKNIPLVVLSQTTRGLQFFICDHDRWDYMMVVAEMLFLLWGSFLCYATRTVPSAFHEPRYMGIALHNELITSTAFHVVRFLMVPSLHPDWTLLLFFVHTHVTTTMTLALLFIPKFLHAGSPLREEIAAEVYEDELDMRRSGSYLNSSITSAWSEHSLDPDDIRDELKKLYTQLEVHKTKKMAANNPHLQKKRSSKRGLGRSLMRRITELPESMSRQCSKEEKDGSVGGGNASRSGSYKRRRLDSGSSSVKLKDDSSSKPKVASSLKKSHSTYDHTRNTKENNLPTRHESYKEAPLLDSMMRKKLAKKASERSNSDSLDDSAPLVYKSASAHNLMAERKPLHPRPSPLQKSLSVVTSAKEKALLLTNRAYLEDSSKLAQDKEKKAATEDSTTESEVSGHTEVTDVSSKAAGKDWQTDDTSERTVSSLLEDGSSSQDTVCPWESVTAPSTPSENKSQKHVTYAPIRSLSINTSELPGRRHHASKKIPPEPPIRQQSLVHTFERKDVTPWDAQEQTQTSGQCLKKDDKERPMLADVHLSKMEESLEKTEVQRNQQTEDNVPPSTPAGLTRLASIAAEVCPWEVMEVPIPRKKDPELSESDSQKSSPEKQIPIPKSTMKSLGLAIKAFNRSRMKTNIRARKDDEGSPKKTGRETSGKNEKHQVAEGALMSVGGSPRQRVISRGSRETVSKQATICPWDEEEEELSSSHKSSPRKVLEVCPWEASADGLTQDRASSTEAPASTCTNRLHWIKSQRESVCPWETIDDDQTKEEKISNISPIVLKTEKKAETCPWELEEVVLSTRSEAQEKASGLHDSRDIKKPPLGTEVRKSPDLSKAEEKKSRSVESHTFSPTKLEGSTDVKTEVCPWEAEESLSKQKMSEEDRERSSREKGTTPRAEAIKTYQEDTVCPWEIMESPERIDAKTTLSQRVSDNVTSSKTAICPWESSDTPSEEAREESREDPKRFEGRKLRSPLSEEIKDRESTPRDSVCPWEDAGAADSSTKPAGKILDLGKIVLKKSSSGDSKKVEVCPWETKTAEVCPWEVVSSTMEKGVEEMEGQLFKGITLKALPPLKGLEDSKQRESVCPWEDTEAEAASLKPSAKTLEPNKASSDSFQSKKAEIAPWEIQEAKIDIKTAICPWESDDTPVHTKKFKKDASSLSKDEKKETRDTAPEKDDDGTRESVCPWERTEDKEILIKPKPQSPCVSKGSSNKSGSVESFKAAVCPWESEGIEVSTKADISPWDTTPAPSDKRSSRHDAGGTLKRTGDVASKPLEKASSSRENICPWETIDTDDSSSEPSAKRPDLAKVKSKKSSSTDSLKAEVCPWESQEGEPSIKAAVCPWEAPESPVGERPSFKSVGAFERPAPQKEAGHSKTTEKIISPLESICPWETMDTDKPLSEVSAKSREVSKVSSKKSDSGDTHKAEVCPWESQEAEPSVKAAICPWDVPESLVDQRPSSKGAEALERHKSVPLEQAGHSKATEKVSSPQEAICPSETMDTSEPSSQSRVKSLGLSKSYKLSSGTDTLKAEVCPWESQEAEPSTKSDVCPWEVSETSVDKRPSLKRAGALEKSKSTSLEQTIHSKTVEKTSSPQESVCPWESVNPSEFSAKPGQSKVTSKKSDSAESLKAEVCPWEVVEESVLRKDDGSRALQREDSRSTSPRSISEAMERLSRSRDDVCPWESMELEGPSMRSAGQSPALSKAGSKKSDSAESLKAEVCPWDVVEESVLRKDDDQRANSTSTSPRSISEAMERLSRSRDDVCPWESMELEGPSMRSAGQSPALSKAGSKKSDSAESLKAEVCPWDVVEESVSRKDDDQRASSTSTSPKSISEAMERLSRSREDICPWESMELEGSSPRSAGQSPALSKAGSKKSDSAESLRAEICPWEFIEEEEVSTKTEVYPWTAAMAPFEKGKLKQDPAETLKRKKDQVPLGALDSKKTGGESSFKKIEKSKSHQESASLWKSMEFDKPPAKITRSLDLLQVSSKKSESVESLKAEICPWEFQEIPTHAKAEICPWEVTEGPPERGTLKNYQGMVSSDETSTSPIMRLLKTEQRRGSQQESVSSCESVELSQTQSPSLPKSGSKKSVSVESLRAEVCPWETEEEEPSGKIETYLPKTAAIPFNEGSLRQHISQGKTQLSPGVIKTGGETVSKKIEKTHSHPELAYPQKSTDELSVKPSSKSLDLPKVVFVKSDSIESLKSEICPWEVQETGASTKSEVCPWEVVGTPLDRETSSRDGAAISKKDMKVDSASPIGTIRTLEKGRSIRESICSWGSIAAVDVSASNTSASLSSKKPDSSNDSKKTEICPWETDQLEKEDICPREARLVLATEDERAMPYARAAEMPAASVKRSQSEQEGLPEHKPLCRSLPETTLPIDLSKGSGPMVEVLAKSRHDSTIADICPWEAEEDPTATRKDSAGITKALSEVCPWEIEDTSPTSASSAKSKAGEKPKADKA